ncbi:hypothetical protein GCM10011391_08190 [Pullulanibacillus camelliae]|uniref:Citrate transporter-like domain-containing protein n=1 Tax=Pullulanibacillus camelliae TaxID=1707096 RepID=A0A8J2VM61_9BACL|nr:hypothetical protein GCM10011391_08190 [Pullulanibacillus camelliae]
MALLPKACGQLMVNYPRLEQQKERIATYAGNALSVVSMVFAAGIFTGILSGTKMVDAMAHVLIAHIPSALGSHFAIITAIISAPFTFFMSNDAFYFGVLPLLAKAASTYGIDPAVIGRASLLGLPVHLLSPLVPSTYLLVGMVREEFGDLQRKFLKWACGSAAAYDSCSYYSRHYLFLTEAKEKDRGFVSVSLTKKRSKERNVGGACRML